MEFDRHQAYFAPVLPWQNKAWQQFTEQYRHQHLPHGLLATGMAGIGKRAFVWRCVAYILCQHKHEQGACGDCPSCHWLKADTHPDLHSLPSPEQNAIKIDDIRQLQDFFAQKSSSPRIVVLDNADEMTLGASNALLKTLEEPNDGIFLFLVSDFSSRLLPTIKSRVQTLPVNHVEMADALAYVNAHLNTHPNTQAKPQSNIQSNTQYDAELLLTLADFAPLGAVQLPSTAWFNHRLAWLKTFVALQTHTRSIMQASTYWQGVLSLADFLVLSQFMMAELWRYALKLPLLHGDISSQKVLDGAGLMFSQSMLQNIDDTIKDISLALHQNIQEKLAYDRLLLSMAK